MSHETESLALHYNVPLALAALLLAGCATRPTAADCHVAKADVAAAQACLAEPACAAKWDIDLFRAQLADNRETVARCEKVRP